MYDNIMALRSTLSSDWTQPNPTKPNQTKHNTSTERTFIFCVGFAPGEFSGTKPETFLFSEFSSTHPNPSQ